MGKQINYWMDYDSFLLLAQKALALGCEIVKEDLPNGKVMKGKDISIIDKEHYDYYFHVPEAGELEIRKYNARDRVEHGYSASGNSLIEAGYSRIDKNKKITRARMYCISGYYDDKENYIERPDCLTKVYHSLQRFVKKIAPYTEITDIRVSMREEDYLQKYEYVHKEYISEKCLELKEQEGYILQ